MEREIMKALVVRDVDALRTIFMQAKRGEVYLKPILFKMLGDYVKERCNEAVQEMYRPDQNTRRTNICWSKSVLHG